MSKELVKEAVVRYLIKELQVPEEMIEIDTPLSVYEDGAEGEIDITVLLEDGEDAVVPLMVVQCLDDEREMTDAVVEKQIGILEHIDSVTNVGRIILTNGSEMMYADCVGSNPENEGDIPTYRQMVKAFNNIKNKN